MSASESPTMRRKDSDDVKTRIEGTPWEQPGGSLLTGQVVASGAQGTSLQPGLEASLAS
jgi:hypothetical protein